MKYRVLTEQDEDGVEATANVKEAIALYLESLAAHNDPVPPRHEITQTTLRQQPRLGR
jgi:hypothetical protein